MKIDAGNAGNISFGDGGDLGTGTEITKQDGKVTLAVGGSDLVNISQVQNSLQLNINDSQTVMLSPEESRNLEIKGDKSQITVDPNVSIPIRGISSPLSKFEPDTGRTGSAIAASRQNETSFTASITQRLLISDLKSQSDPQIDQPAPTALLPHPAPSPAVTKTEISTGAQSEIEIPVAGSASENLASLGPAEKSNILNQLVNNIQLDPLGAVGNRADIRQIVQSIRSPEEFKSILNGVERSSLQEAITKDVPDLRADATVADFNIAASVFGFPELATQPDHARIGLDALALGFTPNQVVSARHEFGLKVGSVGDFPADAALKFSANPLMMTVTTPEEKSAMLGALLGQEGTDPDLHIGSDRAIVSILEFSNSKAEFDFLVDTHGGKEILAGMLDPQAIAQFNKLAGGYERLSLATARDEAIETFGALSFLPEVPENLQTAFAAPTGGLSELLSGIFAGIDRQISALDRRSLTASVLENAIREAQGLPPFDPIALRRSAAEMLREVPVAGWACSLDHLRDQAGLSEYAMREIVTQPMANILSSAASELAALIDSTIPVLEDRLKKVVTAQGTNSIAADIGRAELMDLRSRIPSSQIQNLIQSSNTLEGLFPLPPRNLEPVLARILPPQDPQGNVIQIPDVRDTVAVLDRLATLPSPDLSRLANLTRQVFRLPEIFPRIGAALESIQKMDPADMPLPLKIQVENGISFVRNISNGTHAQALNSVVRSLQGYGDPELRKVSDFAREGAVFFSELVSGGFRQTLADFTAGLATFLTHPAVSAAQNLNVESGVSAEETISSFRDAADEFAGSEPFLRAMETVRMSGDFVGALYRGNFVRIVAPLNSRFGNSPAVLHVIQSGLHITTQAGTFLRGIVHHDFERPIVQTLRRNPSNKGLKEANEIFTQAAQSFVPIANVEYMDAIWQYHKQLDLVRGNDLSRDLAGGSRQNR